MPRIDHLQRVEDANADYLKARAKRDAAIKAAVRSGLSLRAVGAAVGLSYERVREIAADE